MPNRKVLELGLGEREAFLAIRAILNAIPGGAAPPGVRLDCTGAELHEVIEADGFHRVTFTFKYRRQASIINPNPH